MPDNESLDEIRKQMQESLAKSKREKLLDEYGMVDDYTNPNLSPEAENDFLDNILEFERQFENAKTITVRERIGNPSITSIEEIAQDELEDAVDKLLDLLYENGIVIDFMGDWDDFSAYRFITEELLDEKMDDIRIEGMYSHFPAETEEYEVQFWAEEFARGVFWQIREHFLDSSKDQPLFDHVGNSITIGEFSRSIEKVWKLIPAETRASFEPTATNINENEATVTAVIKWQIGENQYEIESFFRLQTSPYYGWDIVQTSLLEDIMDVPS